MVYNNRCSLAAKLEAKMNNENLADEVMHKITVTLGKFIASEKKQKSYGTDIKLYRGEVHTIEAIGNNSGIGISDLAKYQGVTKGAVSQMADKLSKKGLINKNVSSDNTVSLTLTEKGKEVYVGHKKYHEEYRNMLQGLLEDIPEDAIKKFLYAFNELDKFLDKQIEE